VVHVCTSVVLYKMQSTSPDVVRVCACVCACACVCVCVCVCVSETGGRDREWERVYMYSSGLRLIKGCSVQTKGDKTGIF
jgi:hypothetical protein